MAQAPKPKPPKPAAAKEEKKVDIGKVLSEQKPPEDPTVAAILATKPTTPEECVRAAKTLVELKRADLAKGLLKKALDAKLDPQQLADLGQAVGLPMFFDLADNSALQPEAKQLADAVAAAIKSRLEDSKRIAALVQQLQDPSAEKRLEAIVGLQAARDAAIGPLLAVLADPARAAEHANVRAALAEMGRAALPPLVAIVEQADPKVAVQAIQVLGAMKDARVALSLVMPALSDKSDPAVREAAAAALKQLTGSVPTRAEAVRRLVDAAKASSGGQESINGTNNGKAERWQWDAAKRQCVAIRCTPEALARMRSAHWAYIAHALAPDDREIGLLYVTAALDAVGDDGNLDVPFFEKKWSDAKAMNEVLKYAMARGRTRAATMAAWLFGKGGKASELLYQGAGPAPLVQAVQSPDRRLRMAALEAIIRLQPSKPFAGSSYVLQELGFLAGSSGSRHALVAAPSLMGARELAGFLVAAGYETDTFTNGRELVVAAAQSPDYELALIDMAIDRPVVGILLQQLRHDPRTASLRVGLIARPDHFDQAERLARLDPLAKAFARPHDNKAFRWQLDQLATVAPEEFVGLEARQQQAAQALDLLAEIDRTMSNLYDPRSVQKYVIAALYNPKLAVKAIGVLANINSAESQQALVEVASRFTQPLALRQAAARAFRQNTQRYGILLTTEQIRQQYQRYNESEKMDRATQHVLGLILDCLEVGVPKKK
jgi:HEAT repeat protein